MRTQSCAQRLLSGIDIHVMTMVHVYRIPWLLFIFVCGGLSVSLFVFLSVCLCVSVSGCLTFWLSPLCLSVRFSGYLSVVCLAICLSVCLAHCLFGCFGIFLLLFFQANLALFVIVLRVTFRTRSTNNFNATRSVFNERPILTDLLLEVSLC